MAFWAGSKGQNITWRQHNRKLEKINKMEKELQGLEEGPKVKLHLDLLRTTLKKVPNRKTPGHECIHWNWFQNLFPSTTDWLSKWIDAFKKKTYPNGWSKERPPKSKRCPRGVMVKSMDYGIVVREFVLQSCYYVHFRANTLGKGMNLLIFPAKG